jgi:2-polyprenyl-3-methyl-5-hydroxy-6-metoxy-1,4-benzoquinol methylase
MIDSQTAQSSPEAHYDEAYFQAQLSKSLDKVAWQYGRLLRWAGVPRRPGLRVLDVGCGAAPALRYLTHLGYESFGSDLVLYPLKQAHRVAPAAAVICNDVTEGHAFADESFDVVLAADVIEHLHDGDALLRECYRVLKPDGYLIVSTVNAWDLRRWTHPRLGRVWSALTDPTHVHFYTPPELGSALKRAGFERVKTWAGLKPIAWLPIRRPRIGVPYPPLLGNGLAATGRKTG